MIQNINRRAKLIIINLSSGYSLLIHLKLTGQLIFQDNNKKKSVNKPDKYTRLVYNFSDSSQLFHNDLRKFGYVKVVPTKELENFLKKEENYGPEPLSKNFTLKLFKKLLSLRPNSKIKPLLMNQSVIAGIGNLYSDEILFESGVRPDRLVKDLKTNEVKKIFQNIKKILKKAIQCKGSSVNNYLDVKGQKGGYNNFIKVYRREGKLCYKCGTEIIQKRINGRSAHFCPHCQK